MAVTPFNARVSGNGSTTYTVPAGKHAVFRASTQNNPAQMLIGGVSAWASTTSDYGTAGPFVATSGQVVSAASADCFISGFLYDN